ncbi:MAG: nuclear transport factor 2 family protein [Anaerolineales bacterium]|nr:nuclear transport factor 2 family protein [Anaerolineales bacterium]
MNNKRNILLAVTVLVWASLACQALSPSDSASVPPETAATEEESSSLLPSDSSATEEEPVQNGGIYDGSWVGTNTVDNKEILFTVENNQVVSVALNYTGESNGCDYHGAISIGENTGGMDPIVVDGESFSSSIDKFGDDLTFAGTFTSESEASGTLLIKSPADGICGVFEKEVSWTASKDSSVDAEPAEDTSGTVSEEDTNSIVTQFFDAVNAGDMDTAMDMVGENVMFNFGTTTQFGRDNLKAYLTSSGLTYQISGVESFSSGMAEFKATASDGTTYSFCTILLQDGEIISLSLQP